MGKKILKNRLDDELVNQGLAGSREIIYLALNTAPDSLFV